MKKTNLADPTRYAQEVIAADLPLSWAEEQMKSLMTAAMVPALASQLRNLNSRFATQLTHAQQTHFASSCLEMATVSGVDLDAELVSTSLQRWESESMHLENHGDARQTPMRTGLDR